MSNQRLSTQDVAAILIDELGKIEEHTTRLASLRRDIAASQQISTQHLAKFEALTKRHITIDTSELVRSIKRKQTLPKWAVWLLIVQPIVIALITTLLVWRYIDHIERVAWSDGHRHATEEQANSAPK